MIKAMWGNYQTNAGPTSHRQGRTQRRVVMQIGRTHVDVIQGAGIQMLLVTRPQA